MATKSKPQRIMVACRMDPQEHAEFQTLRSTRGVSTQFVLLMLLRGWMAKRTKAAGKAK